MSRIFLFCLILMHGSCSTKVYVQYPENYQDDSTVNNYPFQVIYADGVTNDRTNEAINAKDLLASWHKIKVSENGYLLLVHHTGTFIELKGDTLISANNLLNKIPYIEDYSETSERLTINVLYDTVRYQQFPNLGLGCYFPYDIQIDLPRIYLIPMNRNNLCLKWRVQDSTASDTLIVTIKNIRDTVIDSVIVQGTELQIDLSKYEDLRFFLLFRIRDYNNPDFSSGELCVRNLNEYFYSPDFCSVISPIHAFELAYFCEMNQVFNAASDYYQLAADLSDHPFYDLMLENFKKRSGLN